MLAYLLQGITLGLSAAATPGPFQAFVIGQALKNGWRRTLPAAFAPLLSDGPVILLMVLLLTSLPAGLLRAIQIAGGVYVLFLAWNALQVYRHFQTLVPAGGSGKTLLQAAGMTLLSPGLYIYWSMLAGPILVRGWSPAAAFRRTCPPVTTRSRRCWPTSTRIRKWRKKRSSDPC